jgi:hypothetical protein
MAATEAAFRAAAGMTARPQAAGVAGSSSSCWRRESAAGMPAVMAAVAVAVMLAAAAMLAVAVGSSSS